MQSNIYNSTVRDSDFSLSQSEGTTLNAATSQSLATMSELKKGDNLYSDCKDVFLDLQRHKNENNNKV